MTIPLGMDRRKSPISHHIYYISSKAWLEHKDPYSTVFAEEFRKYQFLYDPRIPTASNPPPLVVVFAGFAILPPVIAFYSWFVIQALSLALTFVVIHRLVRGRYTLESSLLSCWR
ncbi:MAG: hypothetical protein LC804_09740 [Acidobacteria bacterium]|nr:hypothetical protein [Acidobacteriota bacterium]